MKVVTLLLLAFALCLPFPAKAQLTLEFDSPELSLKPGDTVTFSGNIKNISSTDTLQIISNSYNLYSEFLSLDDTKFNLHAPTSLAPGASWHGELFDVLSAGNTPYGTYTGNFTLHSENALNNVTTNFSVKVVPAPGALTTTFLGGLPGVLFFLRRRRTNR